MRISAVTVFGTLAILAATSAQAGPIASRPALVALLGGPGTLETFENFSVGPSSFAFVDCDPISSTAICNGQGPGLVVPGLEITGKPAWQGVGYFGLPSKTLGDTKSSDQFRFTIPVTAFGADLFAYTGFPSSNAAITIYGLDFTTVIGSLSGLSLSTSGTFVGWTDVSGIGAFSTQYNGSLSGYMAVTDNLEFGNIAGVPEPESIALFFTGLAGLAAARRRRKAKS